MRRATVTTDWIAKRWEARAKVARDVSKELQDGLAAYALEQAGAERKMSAHWTSRWSFIQEMAERCLACEGALGIRVEEGSSYFSNDDTEDIDVDNPEAGMGRQAEPITIEITVEDGSQDDNE